ncbi:hypothetical protein ACSVDA_03835 [Cytobacillus sp. Hm23]
MNQHPIWISQDNLEFTILLFKNIIEEEFNEAGVIDEIFSYS